MKVTKPIFIVGTGRCGSTAFHNLLARHPDTMWLSGFAEKFPDKPAWNRRAVTAVGNPLVRGMLGNRIKPGENYGFWYRHAYGFAEPGRDMVRADVTPRVRKQVRRVIEAMLTPRHSRMLVKLTGWSRIGFLNEIFDDAKFIHIVRDGRAVASSLLHISSWQWRGWYGPYSWRYGPLSPEDQAAWEASDRSFAVLAGLQWRIHTRSLEAARQMIDARRFLEVRYETLCEQPLETCRRAAEFAELPQSASFEQHVRSAPIKDMTARWRTDLSAEQQGVLTTLLRDDLLRYGYEVSPPRVD
ncbi:MAG: sulfotransferase [Gemmatimonadales bacterium]|nr:sulfotransferase [Gemmatimonadales bacterium]